MQPDKVSELLLYFKNLIPDDRIANLEFFLQRLSDDDFDAVKSINLRSPKLTLALAIFTGFLGADRFYIGDTITGIQKLLFSLLTLGVWPFVDIFITFRLCKEENYLTITEKIKDLI